mmetsp:Transcript_124360/g.352071  ORF Transcript_124360/g.352071 Transcript_124360/m.352071 type:complete len:230 (-) Transcript_124360:652-1341(-)
MPVRPVFHRSASASSSLQTLFCLPGPWSQVSLRCHLMALFRCHSRHMNRCTTPTNAQCFFSSRVWYISRGVMHPHAMYFESCSHPLCLERFFHWNASTSPSSRYCEPAAPNSAPSATNFASAFSGSPGISIHARNRVQAAVSPPLPFLDPPYGTFSVASISSTLKPSCARAARSSSNTASASASLGAAGFGSGHGPAGAGMGLRTGVAPSSRSAEVQTSFQPSAEAVAL